MTPPRHYAEWLPVLDRFAAGDDDALELMQLGTFEWTAGAAERWTTRILQALSARLDALTAYLQRALDASRGDRFHVSRAMLDARRRLAPLRAFANLPALPEVARLQIVGALEKWVAETQATLEKSAAGVRGDQGWMAKTIRDHRLDAPMSTAEPALPPPQNLKGTGRRPIIY